MSGKLRKSQAHTARRARHEDKRRQKREKMRAYGQTVPAWMRRGNNIVTFSERWNVPVRAWERSKAA